MNELRATRTPAPWKAPDAMMRTLFVVSQSQLIESDAASGAVGQIQPRPDHGNVEMMIGRVAALGGDNHRRDIGPRERDEPRRQERAVRPRVRRFGAHRDGGRRLVVVAVGILRVGGGGPGQEGGRDRGGGKCCDEMALHGSRSPRSRPRRLRRRSRAGRRLQRRCRARGRLPACFTSARKPAKPAALVPPRSVGARTRRGVLKRLPTRQAANHSESRASADRSGSGAQTKPSRGSHDVHRVTRPSRLGRASPAWAALFASTLDLICSAGLAFAQVGHRAVRRSVPHRGGEDSLVIPAQLDTLQFFGLPASKLLDARAHRLRALGVVFGLVVYQQLKNAPVHKSMLEVSELIYETCKTYLVTQAKFLGILVALHRRRHRRLLRRPQGRVRRHRRCSSSSSASSASPAAPRSPSSASA